MTREEVKALVAECLARVEADTPEGVAEKLAALGVKGVCQSPWSCPMACHIKKSVLGLSSVVVYPINGSDTPGFASVRFDDNLIRLPLSQSVNDMAIGFDMGKFPQLEGPFFETEDSKETP